MVFFFFRKILFRLVQMLRCFRVIAQHMRIFLPALPNFNIFFEISQYFSQQIALHVCFIWRRLKYSDFSHSTLNDDFPEDLC